MLTVLGGLAEFERELMRARTGEGRERAKARGVKMGRKPKLTPHQQREAVRRRSPRRQIRAGRERSRAGASHWAPRLEKYPIHALPRARSRLSAA
jgi:DNA invertase Pin-like site-specific DNA recombinase